MSTEIDRLVLIWDASRSYVCPRASAAARLSNWSAARDLMDADAASVNISGPQGPGPRSTNVTEPNHKEQLSEPAKAVRT
jgi:hypothetical protein